MTNDLDTAREIFRNHVLEAMDEAALQIFGLQITGGSIKNKETAGSTDADLPEIFRFLDDHLIRLSERYGVHLWDFTPAQWENVRRQKAENAALHGSMP